jgi:glycosyltransferase involved in cell wall biosynthesis
MNRILCLNDNPVPIPFHSGVVSGKEFRLQAAIEAIDEIHVLAPVGAGVVSHIGPITSLEKKVIVHHLTPFPYYLRTIPLFIFGLFYYFRLKPNALEAESPIISGVAAVMIKKITGIKIIINLRASYEELIKFKLTFIPLRLKNYLLMKVTRFVYTHQDAVIANSNMYQKSLPQNINSWVINPGVQSPPKWQAAVTYPPVIGFIGRLVPEKGVHLLLDALYLLKQDSQLIWRAEIVGDGPERRKLERLTKKYGLVDNVTFKGFQPNFKIMKHWYCLVNPNLVKHPLEMVNAEAAYLGIPVICFGNNQYPETVIDEKTGIKVKQTSTSSLSDALVNLLRFPKKRQILSQNACQFARKNYNFNKQVNKYSELYQTLGFFEK